MRFLKTRPAATIPPLGETPVIEGVATGIRSRRPHPLEETRMIKAGIDTDALVKMFSEASAKQGDALRKAVSDATLKALQGRELTMANIRTVLKTVTQAASTGAAQNVLPSVDVEGLL